MGNRPGIVWGTNAAPNDFVVRLSTYSDQFSPENIARLTNNMLEDAAEEVEALVRSRGVKDGVPNNNGRIGETHRLVDSITYRSSWSPTGRVIGEFGYLDRPPAWALWQEYGTNGGQGNGRGILAMLALTDAYRGFAVRMEDLFSQGGISNRNQGFYRYDAQLSAYSTDGGIA